MDEETFSHKTRLETPSMPLWMLKPYGFNLSCLSICQTKLGPGDVYFRRRRRLRFLSWTPSESLSYTIFLISSRRHRIPLEIRIGCMGRQPTLLELPASSLSTASESFCCENLSALLFLLFLLSILFKLERLRL